MFSKRSGHGTRICDQTNRTERNHDRERNKSKSRGIKALVKEDEDLLRSLMKTALQEVLEAEMSEALGAGKGERSAQWVGAIEAAIKSGSGRTSW